MDIKDRLKFVLEPGTYSHPVLWSHVASIERDQVPIVDDPFLVNLFGKKPKGLKMWDGKGDVPHYLACRNGINLHTDPGYSRYAYQLVVRNDGWMMTGLDDQQVTRVDIGTCYELDTHSPHQLVKSPDCSGRFFVAVGFDSPSRIDAADAIDRLRAYLKCH